MKSTTISFIFALVFVFLAFFGVKPNSRSIPGEDSGALNAPAQTAINPFYVNNAVLETRAQKVFIEPKIAGESTLLSPRSMKGVEELIGLLKGFGELINVSKDQLTEEFARRDAEIIKKTKEVYRNPEQFELGQQCGGEGAAFAFPPGGTTRAACGGDPEYSITGGGGSCNTDPECFGTGFCFFEFYCYLGGCYGYCWVPSCLGKCGFQSYLWDSVTKTCGCGAFGDEDMPKISEDSTSIPDDAKIPGESVEIDALDPELAEIGVSSEDVVATPGSSDDVNKAIAESTGKPTTPSAPKNPSAASKPPPSVKSGGGVFKPGGGKFGGGGASGGF